MSTYKHHIFISYRRSDEKWVKWTRENFKQALETLLRPRLGHLSVYMDETIETGDSWPQHIAQNLSRSRLMVAVLSRDYFQSDWCRLELALMHHREEIKKYRTSKNPSGLIIPVVIDDGHCFPPEIQAIQSQSLHEFANPYIRLDSPKQEELAEVIRTKLCPSIEHALEKAPEFDPEWEGFVHEKFEDLFRIKTAAQTTVPSLELPNIT